MKYKVLFYSQTGNTEKIAKAIFEALPGEDKDIRRLEETQKGSNAEIYFIGFPVHMGTCNMEMMDFLGGLQNTKIALFATCGKGDTPEYYKQIENQTAVWIPDENEYLGMFLCQGKMPITIRHKYESMQGSGSDEQIQKMLRNFDKAFLRPDVNDIKAAKEFAKEISSKCL